MTNISTLGAALDQIARLKVQQSQMDTLTTQIATGKKTQAFSGLGTDVLLSKRARADIGSVETYIDNIKNGDRRIKMMLSGLKQVKEQAQTILGSIQIAVQKGDFPDLNAMKDLSGNVSSFLMDLMNLQDGDRYLFAGADVNTKPISDTGLFDSFMGEYVPDETNLTNPPLISSGVVGLWGDGTITTDQFIDAYRNVSETILGYSNKLVNDQAGRATIRVDDHSEYDYTVLADTPGMKEILTALQVFEAMPPPEYAPGALNNPTATTFAEDTAPFPPEEKQQNFYQVLNDLASMMHAALDKLDDETYHLAQVQAQITHVKENHQTDLNTLRTIVSDVEDVDLTEAATKANQIQITMEASYRLTASLSNLTLVNFL